MMTKLLVVAAGMLAFGFALVPCTARSARRSASRSSAPSPPCNTQVDRSREVTVELVASSAGLDWRFEALDRSVKLHPGELATGALPGGEHAGSPGHREGRDEYGAGRGDEVDREAGSASASATRPWPRARRARCGGVPRACRCAADLATVSLSYTFFETGRAGS
jgi:cytochrome c oxidase assembly protein subunit 11